MNLAQCDKCGAPLIAEELKAHKCFGQIQSIEWSEFDGFSVFDGKTWYRWFPADETLQEKRRRGLDSSA